MFSTVLVRVTLSKFLEPFLPKSCDRSANPTRELLFVTSCTCLAYDWSQYFKFPIDCVIHRGGAYNTLSSLVQVAVFTRQVIHPTFHEVLGKDEGQHLVRQEGQCLRYDLETPVFPLRRGSWREKSL
jgi:hypothetical protein